MRTITFAIAAALALGASANHAQAAEDMPSVRVSYADLDLRTAAGKATLEHRIEGAVRRLCDAPSPLDVASLQRYRACRSSAWLSARPQLAVIYGQDRYAERGRAVQAALD